METCTNSHSRCHPSELPRLPLRVIDVGLPDGTEDPFIYISENGVGEYVTLSYRWGDVKNFTTTISTLPERASGISMGALPATMRDAVIITRLLGLRYLWIDALCILQDSEVDWDEQSAELGVIYQNAWLNISADVAENSDAGFLGSRNLLKIRNCEHPTLIGTQKRLICPFIGGARDAVNKPLLTERGWIFPERLLSKRILHWSSREVVWECNTSLASESQPGSLKVVSLSDEVRWRKIRSITQGSLPVTSSTGAHLPPDCVALPSHRQDTESTQRRKWVARARNFEPWYKLVTEYSKRLLTKPADKLPAISALAALFQRQFDMPPSYIAGLWSEDLTCGLAWSVSRSNELENNAATDFGKLSISTGPTESTEYRAPSFSWASADGSIHFHDNTFSYFSRPDDEPEFLDYKIKLGGSDQFGRVVNGYIKVRGLLQPLGGIPLYRLAKTSPGFLFDKMSTKNSFQKLASQVWLLYLGSDVKDLELYLMLYPIDAQATKYRRIGMLTSNDPCHDHATKTDVVIV